MSITVKNVTKTFGTFVALCTSGAFAETTTLTLGTATPGGGFAVYGQAVADRIAVTDPSLRIELRATRGSGENVPLLEAGKLDLALIEGTIAHDVVGDGSKVARLLVVAAMYPSAGMFVVRADSPYRKVLDLKGRRVVFGASSSGLVVLARYVLDGLDLILSEMGKRNLKAVVFFSNNWEWSGGFQQYLIWNKTIPDKWLTEKPTWDELRDNVAKFYSCEPCKDAYGRQAELIIRRRNSVARRFGPRCR